MRIAIRPRLLSILIVLVGLSGCAGAGETRSPQFDHSHAVLDSLLSAYVEEGSVDYRGIESRRSELLEYLESLGRLDRTDYDGFTRDQKLALLINAYNAFTLELILRHYPVASIQEIDGNWTDQIWPLAGDTLSLNGLENEIIRPEFKEPRIHFALVCAARGCPPLQPAAYTAEKLEEQLASASRGFARDRLFNRLDKESSTLRVSKLFEWYVVDFTSLGTELRLPEESDGSAEHRGVIGFFIEHLDMEEAAFLEENAVRISYLNYDWNLNDRFIDIED